ncbi:MAG: nucleotidyl transferase AbiEii/AbiGii toxin family protein [Candidatus Asgardarchaeia archaeon]
MREFVEEVSKKLGLDKNLIERDFILHQILLDLSNTSFVNEFVFKGGSCLIKHYLGYYRFSMDLDFTFLRQSIFKGLSQKSIRRLLSNRIDSIGRLFEEISENRALNFKCEKGNKRYVELGGGNKFATFKFWLPSTIGVETLVKIQINFVEELIFPLKKVELKSICPKIKELEFLFPRYYTEYRAIIPFNVYDIREILCEKIRAILTRRGFKERDFIDVYFILNRFNINLEELEKEIIEKIRFVLKLYQKYRENLRGKVSMLDVENFPFGSEGYLLIEKIDEKRFYSFLTEFMPWLKKLAKNII